MKRTVFQKIVDRIKTNPVSGKIYVAVSTQKKWQNVLSKELIKYLAEQNLTGIEWIHNQEMIAVESCTIEAVYQKEDNLFILDIET